MSFIGFSKEDFKVFEINGLEERMKAIQERIQPKFKSIGEALTADLSVSLGNEMFLHIAKHARRTKNPPKDTWLAIANNKRGYKQHPHFQVGLFDDHVFIWLAYIYELPNKHDIADKFLANMDVLQSVPNDFVISLDHTKKDAFSVEEADIEKCLERFRDVKKAEFLIGKHIEANHPILQNGDELLETIRSTFNVLLPLYKISQAQNAPE